MTSSVVVFLNLFSNYFAVLNIFFLMLIVVKGNDALLKCDRILLIMSRLAKRLSFGWLNGAFPCFF